MGREFTTSEIKDGRLNVTKTSAGKWRGLISYYQGGERKQITRVFPADVRTKAQAGRALGAWHRELIAEAEQRAEEAERIKNPVWTIGDYMERVIALSPASDSTRHKYRPYMKRINARFGELHLEELTADMVADWQEELKAEGLADATIVHAHALLSQVMRHAHREDGLIPFNPCEKKAARPPRRKHTYPNALGEAERGRLLDYLESAPYRPVVLAARIAIETGMRRGELCGLRWKDVDLDGERGYIHVRNAVALRAGGTYEKEPKTGHSIRDIPISDGLRDVLRKRRGELWAERMELVETTSEAFSELYVIGKADGSYISPDVLGRDWSALSKALALKGTQGKHVSLHDLRHTFATAAITSERADVSSVSSILGHADIGVTLRAYASPDEEATRRAMDKHAETLEAERKAAREKREREEAERGHVYYLPNGTEGR